MQLKALLLDLDGTLINTAPDMVATLNRVLKNHNQNSADEAQASKLVSNGARALLEFGFADNFDEDKANDLIEEYLVDYAQHISDKSYLYDGMADICLLYTSPSPRDRQKSRMPSSA